MKTAKIAPTQPVGFAPGAQLYELSADVDYRAQTIKINRSGIVPEIKQMKFVVFSPGKNGAPKIFPADKKGYCISWFHIEEFKGTSEPAVALNKLGYKLIS